MANNDPLIPFRIAELILGLFLQKLTGAEQNELDNWISNSIENQRLFETCLEMSARSVRPIDEESNAEDFRYIADLFMKKIKQTITAKERNTLEKWKKSTNIDPLLLKSLEDSSSIEMLFERIKMHFHNMNTN